MADRRTGKSSVVAASTTMGLGLPPGPPGPDWASTGVREFQKYQPPPARLNSTSISAMIRQRLREDAALMVVEGCESGVGEEEESDMVAG
jgi:hypothetical protein